MIYYIKVSSNSKYIIATEFEKKIHTWDLINKKKIYSAITSFSSSEERISLSNDENSFVCCSWDKKSIILHNIIDGSIIWENKHINHINSLRYSSDDKMIYAQGDNFLYYLTTSNGNIVNKLQGDYDRRDSKYNQYFVIIRNMSYDIYLNNNLLYSIPFESFANLDLCFGEKFICVSESGSNLKLFCLEDGKELWTYKPEKGKHFTNISFNIEDNIIYGVLYSYTKLSNCKLIAFNANKGNIIYELDLKKRLSTCFDYNGKILATSDGDIFYLNKDKSKIRRDLIIFE